MRPFTGTLSTRHPSSRSAVPVCRPTVARREGKRPRYAGGFGPRGEPAAGAALVTPARPPCSARRNIPIRSTGRRCVADAIDTTAFSSAATRAALGSTQDHGLSSIGLALDGVRRRPRLRHDQRANQGVLAAALGRQITSPTAASRICNTSMTWPRRSFAVWMLRITAQVVQPPRRRRRSTDVSSSLVSVDPAAERLIHSAKQIPIAFDLDDAAAARLGTDPRTPLVEVRRTLCFSPLARSRELDRPMQAFELRKIRVVLTVMDRGQIKWHDLSAVRTTLPPEKV